MNLIIRNETEADYREVEELTREAFWNLYFPGCDEHYLVHIMRNHPDFIRDLDFVAVSEGRIIGSILYTKSHVTDEAGNRMDTLSFGPLCVHPDFQRKGVGKALIEHTKKLAIEMDCPAILIYGSPHNYCAYGFRNGIDFNIANAEGKHPYGLLVRELKKGVFDDHRWTLTQSSAFEFDPKDVEAFDKTFTPKKKDTQYSQVEFAMSVRAYLE